MVRFLEWLPRNNLGRSAGKLFAHNTTQDADAIIEAFGRGIEAIKADPRSKKHIPVIVIDGARNNKTMSMDAINPQTVAL